MSKRILNEEKTPTEDKPKEPSPAARWWRIAKMKSTGGSSYIVCVDTDKSQEAHIQNLSLFVEWIDFGFYN